MFFVFVATSLVFLQIAQQNSSLSRPQKDERYKSTVQDSQRQHSDIIFRVTTREVLIDLIALDDHKHPILDLKLTDLTVSVWWVPSDSNLSNKRHNSRIPSAADKAPITSLHIIDPTNAKNSGSVSQAGFQISASCLEQSALHYQLAIRPGEKGWKSGYHQMVISTSRQHVRLFYRHDYYVGLEASAGPSPTTETRSVEQLLMQATCYYPQTPLSISLQAHILNTDRADVLRYSITVDTNSLSYLTVRSNQAASGSQNVGQDDLRRIQLDYAVCNFDSSGRPIKFFYAPMDQVFTAEGYSRALAEQFPHILQFPMDAKIAVTRIVVRDRVTGNLGAINVRIHGPEQLPSIQSDIVASTTNSNLQAIKDKTILQYSRPPQGPIGSFGSIVATPDSFCGDVYELQHTSNVLPDFRELDPIGSLYTYSLDVPNQVFSNTAGIPGVTPRTDLFGIDYRGTFWVNTPGEYDFLMLADDGAILEIDDKKIINLDGIHKAEAHSGSIHLRVGAHTIHVPYYQGSPISVALELWVKSPGAKQWDIFDLRSYTPPSESKN